MEEIHILDRFVDDREFRNYIHTILIKNGFTDAKIDDERIADGDFVNDNDILARSDGTRYTIHTYLNIEVGVREVLSVIQDREYEKVDGAIIFTNRFFTDDAIFLAKREKVELWDRDQLKRMISVSEKYDEKNLSHFV